MGRWCAEPRAAVWVGLPGVSSVMNRYIASKMDVLDISPIPEFIEMIADTGAGLYACEASADLFGITKADLIDQVKDIITVGEFYDLAAGGEIIFTRGPSAGCAARPRHSIAMAVAVIRGLSRR
jgi:predicted peroxiredoxin